MEDHNPPHLMQIFAFLERAAAFAAEDEEHVLAVSPPPASLPDTNTYLSFLPAPLYIPCIARFFLLIITFTSFSSFAAQSLTSTTFSSLHFLCARYTARAARAGPAS